MVDFHEWDHGLRNGITDGPSLSYEMFHWLLYSVAVSLIYFVLTLLVWWITKHPVTWVELLKSGGLVTYASTLSAKTLASISSQVRE
jgi:hypothetical protein